MQTLICYSSCDGQAKKIAQSIEQHCSGDVTVINLDEAAQWVDPKGYDQVLIGASIRYGHFRKSTYQYIEQYTDVLNNMPSAFFGVCLTARKPGKDDPQRNVYMRKFMQRHQWQPTLRAMFAGALQYSIYNWWQTLLIQLIMKMTGGSTDRSQDIEFTDWDKVANFAQRFNQLSQTNSGHQ